MHKVKGLLLLAVSLVFIGASHTVYADEILTVEQQAKSENAKVMTFEYQLDNIKQTINYYLSVLSDLPIMLMPHGMQVHL